MKKGGDIFTRGITAKMIRKYLNTAYAYLGSGFLLLIIKLIVFFSIYGFHEGAKSNVEVVANWIVILVFVLSLHAFFKACQSTCIIIVQLIEATEEREGKIMNENTEKK